jgi:UDP-glucose 4-epimerase
MKAIVTGGLGFIGSHLVERLLKDGFDVIVLDDLTTGRRSNLKEVLGDPHLLVVEADVAEYGSIQMHFQNVDFVFHLAALADIVPSIQRPLDYYHSNVTGTISVLEAARTAGVKRFVYVASSSCYGIPDVYPTLETAPIQLHYPYALTKYLGEQISLHWGKVYKMSVVSLRLFNVYGPRARTTGAYGAVFGIFLAQKIAGKPLTVVGDGNQSRDFTYVTDAVQGLLVAAKSDLRDEIFNVGSGSTYSVNYLADLIGGPRVYIPKRPGEPDRTWADISKMQTMLGWSPQVSFEEGVHRMLERIRDWADAPVWTPETIAEATKDWYRYLSQA